MDVKATDPTGAVYSIEVQLTVFEGLVQRIVFYGCEIYADQLRAGDGYGRLRPAFSICLVDGVLWPDARQVHHAFVLTDATSGRTLDGTLAIHTLELGRYNVGERELGSATLLDCWLYWLLHAHEYEREDLLRLFPQQAIRQATETIARIAEITEDKTMYDAREKARRDREWELRQSLREGEAKGEIKGEIKLIRTLQGILRTPVSDEQELAALSLEQLQTMTASLQESIRNRTST